LQFRVYLINEDTALVLWAQDKMAQMVGHLAGLSKKRLILSFAPSTPYYEVLKRIGEFFPKGSKVRNSICDGSQRVDSLLERSIRADITITSQSQ
jgi:magnesium-protoporphyrin O-methyltransferase